MERILLSENENEQTKNLNTVEDLVNIGNRLSEAYKCLNLGEFDADVFADALLNNCNETHKKFAEQAKADAEKISNYQMRAILLKGVEEFENPFIDAVRRCGRTTDDQRAMMHFVTFTDGVASIADKDVECIKEAGRVYLTDPEEIELYKKHKTIIDGLNDFFEHCKMPVMWTNLFPLWQGKFETTKANIYYAMIEERKQRKNENNI